MRETISPHQSDLLAQSSASCGCSCHQEGPTAECDSCIQCTDGQLSADVDRDSNERPTDQVERSGSCLPPF
jgi:hypothetical protein